MVMEKKRKGEVYILPSSLDNSLSLSKSILTERKRGVFFDIFFK